jgi:uncharacterized membrane protein YdjX (TVP38/TMEM64 family)
MRGLSGKEWRRFLLTLLPICAVAAIVGVVLGQLLGLTVGLGVIATMLGIAGVVLNWRAVRKREEENRR